MSPERLPPSEPARAPQEELLARLERAIGEIHDSEHFRAYLDVQAKFHHFSPFNIGLILVQKPEATRVMGYGNKEGTTGWKSLGRQVMKGERAIKIFAPMFRKEVDEATGAEERRLRGFKLVSVFDILSTMGAPLVEMHVPVLEGDEGGELYGRLADFAARAGLRIEDMPTEEMARQSALMGYFDPTQQLIRVRTDVAQLQRTKTLAHELGHYQAGHAGACNSDERREAETEAEAIAYVVCGHFGLDTGQRSYPYIATWSQDRATLGKVLGRIQQTSSAIIRGIEGDLAHSDEEDLPEDEPGH